MAEVPDDYPQRYLDSRLHHVWRHVGYYTAGPVLVKAETCPVSEGGCGGDRWIRWHQTTGRRLPILYDRPEGYHIQGGVKPYQVRIELAQRAITSGKVYESEEALNAALGKSIKGKKAE